MTHPIDHRPDPELDLVFERVVDVPRSSSGGVDEPQHLKKWFTPAPWQTVDCEIDLRPGGIFRTVMRSPEGQEFPNLGCYLEVVKRTARLDQCSRPGYRPPPAGRRFVRRVRLHGRHFAAPHAKATKYTALVLHADEEARRQHERWASRTAGARRSISSSRSPRRCKRQRARGWLVRQPCPRFTPAPARATAARPNRPACGRSTTGAAPRGRSRGWAAVAARNRRARASALVSRATPRPDNSGTGRAPHPPRTHRARDRSGSTISAAVTVHARGLAVGREPSIRRQAQCRRRSGSGARRGPRAQPAFPRASGMQEARANDAVGPPPIGNATSDESGRCPMRTATSRPSSTRSTTRSSRISSTRTRGIPAGELRDHGSHVHSSEHHGRRDAQPALGRHAARGQRGSRRRRHRPAPAGTGRSTRGPRRSAPCGAWCG